MDIAIRLFGLGPHSFKANEWNLFDVIIALGALITMSIAMAGYASSPAGQLRSFFLASIAFKLVQRMNNLNILFKIAV